MVTFGKEIFRSLFTPIRTLLKTWRRGFKALPGRNGNYAVGWVA